MFTLARVESQGWTSLQTAAGLGIAGALMVTFVFPLSLILLARYLMPQQVQPISAFPAAANPDCAQANPPCPTVR